MDKPMSFKEERIRKITNLYYSRNDVQNAIFKFSQDREVCPRYFEGFGKRPDSFQYPAEILNLVKKGATSFHCSEEIWTDPLQIKTGMSEQEANEIRTGWDLLLDIDCKWFDYSKLAAEAIVKSLESHGVKNVGIKFSGSKGFHIIIPWNSFPKEINSVQTKNLFPEIPRKLAGYIAYHSEKILKESLPDDFYKQFKDVKINRGYRCKNCGAIADEVKQIEFNCKKCGIIEIKKFHKHQEIPEMICYECKNQMNSKLLETNLSCSKCDRWDQGFDKVVEIDLYELLGLDIVLVSSRHLFRMPYSLHEKTALASVVIDKEKISEFQMKDADPLKVEVKDFLPESEEGEASRLVMQALDWSKENLKKEIKNIEYKKIEITDRSEKNFPPCIKKILLGINDGKKRALFVLINFLRQIGVEKDELEKIIYSWNEKNKPPLHAGYVRSQISWSLRKKPILPPNCRNFYKDIGMCFPDNLCGKIKNPINYIVRKNFKRNNSKKKDNFKNNN